MTPARSLLLGVTIAAAFSAQALQRSIEIWSEYPIALEIAWVTIDDSGKETVTARRKTAVGPPVPLDFTHGNDRYVRFSYQGASPRTYSTAELITAKKLHVPDVLPGGELLLLVPPMTVRPVELYLEGPRTRRVPLGSAVHTSLSGLPAGDYRVFAYYEGGEKGAMQTATVRTAHTTIAAMAAEPVGAVRVRASDEVCARAIEIGIRKLVALEASGKAPPNRLLVVTSKQPRCEMTFGGLKPGSFEVYYRSESLNTARSEFEIEPQAVSAVEVVAGRVRVDGRVTLNGRPVATAVLSFFQSGGASGPAVIEALAATDPSGFYSIALETAGKYSVMLRQVPTGIVTPRQAAFVEGRNVYDVALTGGAIKIILMGWDQRTSLQIRIDNKSRKMVFTFGAPMKTLPPIEPLPFGEYNVSVGQASTFARPGAANAKTVVLTAASPEVTLTFDVSIKK